jgi:hypothetical protein
MKKRLCFWKWKVKIKFFKDIQTWKHIGFSCLDHGTLIIWIYTSVIYTQGMWLLRPSKQTPLFSKQNLHIFALCNPHVSSSAGCPDSNIPCKMLEELMSSEKHHMIFNRSWSPSRVAENQKISSFPWSMLWLSEWQCGDQKVLERKLFLISLVRPHSRMNPKSGYPQQVNIWISARCNFIMYP